METSNLNAVRFWAQRVVDDLKDRRQMDWVLRAKIRTLGLYLEHGTVTPWEVDPASAIPPDRMTDQPPAGDERSRYAVLVFESGSGWQATCFVQAVDASDAIAQARSLGHDWPRLSVVDTRHWHESLIDPHGKLSGDGTGRTNGP